MRWSVTLLATALLLAGGPAVIQADTIYNFAYGGTFANDQGVQFIYFYISAPSDVQIYTLSYAGGTHVADARTNLADSDVLGGGFVPALSVFALEVPDQPSLSWQQLSTANGTLQAVSYGGGGVDSGEYGEASVTFDDLPSGWYVVALTEYDNTPNGNLHEGFAKQGNGNFTAAFCGGTAPFCDPEYTLGNGYRDGHWGVDVLNVSSSFETPEPATLFLLIGGILMIGASWLRRKLRAPGTVAVANRVPTSRMGLHEGHG
jgi:hypothetical protein